MKQCQEDIQELNEDEILAKAQQESSREAWPERKSFTRPWRNTEAYEPELRANVWVANG